MNVLVPKKLKELEREYDVRFIYAHKPELEDRQVLVDETWVLS